MNPYTHAAKSMQHFMGNSSSVVPGLPRLSGGRNPQLGSTKTFLNPADRPSLYDVGGQPSMKVVPQSDGSVQTVLKRNARSAEFMTQADWGTYKAILKDMQREAESLSKGGLSLAELRKRGHPFGRGLLRGLKRGKIAPSGRAGVPNLAVVNKQSGRFLSLWSTDIVKGKTGADFKLIQGAPYAKYLLGTSVMLGHGPFTIAMLKHLRRLDAAWRKAAKEAALRESIVEQFS